MANGLDIEGMRKVAEAKSKDQVIIMTIEEMAELTQVLTKILRKDNTMHTPKELYSELHEEYADVVLMLAQIQYVFHLDSDETFDMTNFKIDRWLKRNGLRESGEDMRELHE